MERKKLTIFVAFHVYIMGYTDS